jgi:hypothetical protein
MRRTTIGLTVVALALAGCGGDDDADSGAPAEPAAEPAEDDAAAPASEPANEPAVDEPAEEPDTATGAPPATGLGDNVAVVTVGDQRYEFDVTPGSIQRCDPDFFGAFWVLGKDADGNGIDMMIPPEGDPNFEDAPYINVGDNTVDIEWVADPDREMAGVDPGESQVDSSAVDGTYISGTATFVDLNATYAFQGGVGDEPQPVTGTFEVLCADG